ncbi:MAG: LytTR family transcriptional regulator, partial [Rhodobacteraceae bacterium]|nr:LytTR family transcriptional regulator [Paracoccaceae bacterium]
MIGLGSIGFLAPGLLLGLLALPVLWWLLRAVPPAPLRRRFPAVTLLLGLEDKETTPDRTPWWLLLLRILAVGAAIVGFAQPILNPTDRVVGKGPLLIAMDASWASAQSWPARQDKLVEMLRLAEQDNRAVAVVRLTDRPKAEDPLAFASASDWVERVDGMV